MASENRIAGCEYEKRENAMTALETLACIKLKRANDNLVATEKQLAMSAERAKHRFETCLPIGKTSKRDRKFQELLLNCILEM